LTLEVIVEIIDKVTLSIVKSKLYGMHWWNRLLKLT
jgi:hypothetical protein